MIETTQAPGADTVQVHVRVLKHAIAASSRARELAEQRDQLARDVSAWSGRARRAEARERLLVGLVAVLAVSVLTSSVIISVILST